MHVRAVWARFERDAAIPVGRRLDVTTPGAGCDGAHGWPSPRNPNPNSTTAPVADKDLTPSLLFFELKKRTLAASEALRADVVRRLSRLRVVLQCVYNCTTAEVAEFVALAMHVKLLDALNLFFKLLIFSAERENEALELKCNVVRFHNLLQQIRVYRIGLWCCSECSKVAHSVSERLKRPHGC